MSMMFETVFTEGVAHLSGKVVTVRIPGRKVRAVSEQAVENAYTDDPAVKVGGMVLVSGLRFAHDPDRPKGERVGHAEVSGGT